MRSRDIKLVGTRGNEQMVLKVSPEDVGKYAIMSGDPARILTIAEHLEDAKELAFSREYLTYTGYYKGVQITAASHGIGCPGAAIVVEELAALGVTHLIRVGTSAAYQAGINRGDLVISTGAMRSEGTTRFFVKESFPAVPDHFLTHALIESALAIKAEKGFKLFVGVNDCTDGFYSETPELIEELSNDYRLLNVDMESAALFTIGHLRGMKTAMMVAIVANNIEDETGSIAPTRMDDAISIALEALYRSDQGQTLAEQIDQPNFAA